MAIFVMLNLSRVTSGVWEKKKPAMSTKIAVYRACIISTLLYDGETWAISGRATFSSIKEWSD